MLPKTRGLFAFVVTMWARLVIPVFRNYFFGKKNVPARIPEDFFFSCVFWRDFLQKRVFGEVPGIPVVWGLHT